MSIEKQLVTVAKKANEEACMLVVISLTYAPGYGLPPKICHSGQQSLFASWTRCKRKTAGTFYLCANNQASLEDTSCLGHAHHTHLDEYYEHGCRWCIPQALQL